MLINKTVARSRKWYGVIGLPAGGSAYEAMEKKGMDVMLFDYRHWLEYDSVALAVLLIGIGLVELIVLRI